MPTVPKIGLLKGLGVTLRTLMTPATTQQYPHVKPDLPPRTRGVIALMDENCTVCMLCARECPDWCIYIDSRKETVPTDKPGRTRTRNVLDRFAIDFALCMYCGICVEVCPFDALFWSPEFEYAEYDIHSLIHEKDKLQEWTYTVLPPPELEDGAVPPAEPATSPTPEAEVAAPTSVPPIAPPGGEQAPASVSSARPVPAEASPGEATVESAPGAARVAEAAPANATGASKGGAEAARAQAEHVEPDQETYDRVLQEQLDKGASRKVAEGRAKAAAVRAARKKASEGEGE